MSSGKFIVLEGVEGAGKSSQVAYIRDCLSAAGRRVLTTREPGGTPLAEAVRTVLLDEYDQPVPPMSELLLMFAARAAHWSQRIEPALRRGDWVVCDRFTDASYAYQGAGRGLGEEAVARLESLVLEQRRPDRVLLFDLPVEQGLERTRTRGERNRFDDEALAFHERVRAAYLARVRAEPARFVVIDAARSPAQVRAQVHAALEDWL